jgi:hypothetical protein
LAAAIWLSGDILVPSTSCLVTYFTHCTLF